MYVGISSLSACSHYSIDSLIMERKSEKTQVSCMWLSSRFRGIGPSIYPLLTEQSQPLSFTVLAVVAELSPVFCQCTHLCLQEKQG